MKVDKYVVSQGQGLLVTDDNSWYVGEFSGGPILSGKVRKQRERTPKFYGSVDIACLKD